MTGIACPQDGCDHVGDDTFGVMRHHREVHMGDTYDFECEVRCTRGKAAGVVVAWLRVGWGIIVYGGCVSYSLLCPLFSISLYLFPTNHLFCVDMQVCHDKFTQTGALKKHMKTNHPDKPHAFVCEVRLMMAVTLNYRTHPRHVASTCVGSLTLFLPLPPPSMSPSSHTRPSSSSSPSPTSSTRTLRGSSCAVSRRRSRPTRAAWHTRPASTARCAREPVCHTRGRDGGGGREGRGGVGSSTLESSERGRGIGDLPDCECLVCVGGGNTTRLGITPAIERLSRSIYLCSGLFINVFLSNGIVLHIEAASPSCRPRQRRRGSPPPPGTRPSRRWPPPPPPLPADAPPPRPPPLHARPGRKRRRRQRPETASQHPTHSYPAHRLPRPSRRPLPPRIVPATRTKTATPPPPFSPTAAGRSRPAWTRP